MRSGARRSLASCVVVCRGGKPAEPRKDPHAARSEDQCSGQRAQWNFPGNPASHDPGLQRYCFFMRDLGINSEDDERVISFVPCSVMPVLCPGEGNGGRQRRPGPSVSPGPGADGRGQNVVPQERLGRCKICEICSEERAGSELRRAGFQCFIQTCLLCVGSLSQMCLSAFISVQVLEAHGLRPISLKPKEVAFKSNHTVKYLSLPSVHWEHTVVKFMD